MKNESEMPAQERNAVCAYLLAVVMLVAFLIGLYAGSRPSYQPYGDGTAVLDVRTGHICEPPEVNQVSGVPTCGR